MKPPKWHRDEIILALVLCYNIEPKEMDYRNPKVIELSKIQLSKSIESRICQV